MDEQPIPESFTTCVGSISHLEEALDDALGNRIVAAACAKGGLQAPVGLEPQADPVRGPGPSSSFAGERWRRSQSLLLDDGVRDRAGVERHPAEVSDAAQMVVNRGKLPSEQHPQLAVAVLLDHIDPGRASQ